MSAGGSEHDNNNDPESRFNTHREIQYYLQHYETIVSEGESDPAQIWQQLISTLATPRVIHTCSGIKPNSDALISAGGHCFYQYQGDEHQMHLTIYKGPQFAEVKIMHSKDQETGKDIIMWGYELKEGLDDHDFHKMMLSVVLDLYYIRCND